MYAFLDQLGKLPLASFLPDDTNARHTALDQPPFSDQLQPILQHPNGLALANCLARHSPFLFQLVHKNPACFEMICRDGPDAALAQSFDRLIEPIASPHDTNLAMRTLRVARQQVALITAIADISAAWNVAKVTDRLSAFADLAIEQTVMFLLRDAHTKAEILLPKPENFTEQSGLLILAMGKLGAHELNYSSDIDLIVLFDPDRMPYQGRQTVQHFTSQLAQKMVSMLQDRTADGYVFRTDLRLRPDPRSTPLAVNVHSAATYYETLGQNWERAAMIKARPVASDPQTAHYFMQQIGAYIWRRHLDFAAIADINSIKRQMSAKVGDTLEIAGHNIKLGRGGIREIEFFIQTKQLIWGGRFPQIRITATEEALAQLVEIEQVTPEEAAQLRESYWFLRMVEHRLQMVADQQTHSLPETDAELLNIAQFLGYTTREAFETALLAHLNAVHEIYVRSMEQSPSLSVDGNLVFTGVEADPETVKTLSRMGYKNPVVISDLIQGWHRGSRRATRSLVSRQILTELIPTLLTILSETTQPDQAFMRFDDFIAGLPAGVQIFSLLQANPELLKLLATTLGTAPALGEILSKQPRLLDAVLHGDFFDPLAGALNLKEELFMRLHLAHDYEDQLRLLRSFKHERQFQAGIQLLKEQTTLDECAQFLSRLADVIIEQTLHVVLNEFEHSHGTIDGGECCILALGKLAGEELTFGSDLDLVFIYSLAQPSAMSSGPKSVDGNTYYQRLASRLIHGFTLLTKEGELYEIDTRLRPGGKDAPLATRLDRFTHYYSEDGWMIERLALVKSRIIASTNETLSEQVQAAAHAVITDSPSIADLGAHICSVRDKIAQQYQTTDPWDVKYIRGGMIDLDFLAQYLCLKHPVLMAQIDKPTSDRIYQAAAKAGIIDTKRMRHLRDAYLLQRDVLSILRLCSINTRIEESSPIDLKRLVARQMKTGDSEELKQRLTDAQAHGLALFQKLVV